MSERPDFTTAPAWQDSGGDVYVNLFCGLWDHRKDRAVDANELRSWAPWTPLDTADEWVRRIDSGKLADVIELAILGRQMSAPRTAKLTAHAVLAALPELMGGAA